VEAEGEARIGWGWSAKLGFSWVEGMMDTYPTSATVEERCWMDKMPPMKGRLAFRWEDPKGRIWAEGDFTVCGPQDKLSPGDVRDTQRIPPGGSPGYAVLGIRGGATLSDNVNAFAAAENLGNRDVRVHGSGVNGAGTNVVLGLEIKVQ
jgi:hemoglobin/transferrin/lactoferrin receptor protein